MKKSFCFILNPLEVTGNLPVELIPNHFLQRADAEQTKKIREKIAKHYPHFMLPAYEYELVDEKKDDNGNKGRKGQQLSSEKWRYWVVTFDGTKIETQDSPVWKKMCAPASANKSAGGATDNSPR